MPASTIVLDGSQQYGTPTITTITGGQAYKLNNIQITRPVETAMDQDANGLPQRQRKTAGIAEMTAEAQLATSATVRPVFGDTFQLTVDVAYGVELWCFEPTEFSASNAPGDIRVVPIKCFKLINGAPTLVA
jgi:hypothetical protein